jgi:hypothetical protein
MLTATRRLSPRLPVVFRLLAVALQCGALLGGAACAPATLTPAPPQPVVSVALTLESVATRALTPSASVAARPSATPDLAATQFVEGLSPEQRAAYAAVQTQLPNDPARWLVAMNETVAAQGSATPTPLPFPVVTEVGQFGVRYRFADPAEIAKLQVTYQRYWDFIAFRDGPPPADLAEALAQYLAPLPQASFSDGECLYADVLGKLEALRAQGLYLRVSEPAQIAWGQGEDDTWLITGGADADTVRAERRSRLMQGDVELVDAATGRVLKTRALTLYLTPQFEYASQVTGWNLTRDENGLYCGAAWETLRSSGLPRR